MVQNLGFSPWPGSTPPLTPNPQQACHGISIRQSLGDKGLPTTDPNFGKAVLKVKHSFARVQNSRVRGTTYTTG